LKNGKWTFINVQNEFFDLTFEMKKTRKSDLDHNGLVLFFIFFICDDKLFDKIKVFEKLGLFRGFFCHHKLRK
jgi:hypothetical protein